MAERTNTELLEIWERKELSAEGYYIYETLPTSDKSRIFDLLISQSQQLQSHPSQRDGSKTDDVIPNSVFLLPSENTSFKPSSSSGLDDSVSDIPQGEYFLAYCRLEDVMTKFLRIDKETAVCCTCPLRLPLSSIKQQWRNQ